MGDRRLCVASSLMIVSVRVCVRRRGSMRVLGWGRCRSRTGCVRCHVTSSLRCACGLARPSLTWLSSRSLRCVRVVLRMMRVGGTLPLAGRVTGEEHGRCGMMHCSGRSSGSFGGCVATWPPWGRWTCGW